jgi:hypothetical protein
MNDDPEFWTADPDAAVRIVSLERELADVRRLLDEARGECAVLRRQRDLAAKTANRAISQHIAAKQVIDAARDSVTDRAFVHGLREALRDYDIALADGAAK